MPKAGFWSIGGYDISFRRDGRWYADEEPITNERIARLFSRHVRRGEEGGWVVDIGIDRQPVRIEDTPLVVTSVERDAGGVVHVTANDGESTPLEGSSLRISGDNVLYCDLARRKRGVLPARFLRAPYYELAMWIEEAEDGWYLRSAGRRYRIAEA